MKSETRRRKEENER